MPWSTNKQSIVSKSNTKAEQRNMAIAIVEIYRTRMLLKEPGVFLPQTHILWCENIVAIALASNPIFYTRMKQMEFDYHFIREKALNKDIQMQHIFVQDQIGDMLTKGQTADHFGVLRPKLMVMIIPVTLLWEG